MTRRFWLRRRSCSSSWPRFSPARSGPGRRLARSGWGPDAIAVWRESRGFSRRFPGRGAQGGSGARRIAGVRMLPVTAVADDQGLRSPDFADPSRYALIDAPTSVRRSMGRSGSSASTPKQATTIGRIPTRASMASRIRPARAALPRSIKAKPTRWEPREIFCASTSPKDRSCGRKTSNGISRPRPRFGGFVDTR